MKRSDIDDFETARSASKQPPGGLLPVKAATRYTGRKRLVIIFTKEPEYGIVFRMKLR